MESKEAEVSLYDFMKLRPVLFKVRQVYDGYNDGYVVEGTMPVLNIEVYTEVMKAPSVILPTTYEYVYFTNDTERCKSLLGIEMIEHSHEDWHERIRNNPYGFDDKYITLREKLQR